MTVREQCRHGPVGYCKSQSTALNPLAGSVAALGMSQDQAITGQQAATHGVGGCRHWGWALRMPRWRQRVEWGAGWHRGRCLAGGQAGRTRRSAAGRPLASRRASVGPKPTAVSNACRSAATRNRGRCHRGRATWIHRTVRLRVGHRTADVLEPRWSGRREQPNALRRAFLARDDSHGEARAAPAASQSRRARPPSSRPRPAGPGAAPPAPTTPSRVRASTWAAVSHPKGSHCLVLALC